MEANFEKQEIADLEKINERRRFSVLFRLISVLFILALGVGLAWSAFSSRVTLASLTWVWGVTLVVLVITHGRNRLIDMARLALAGWRHNPKQSLKRLHLKLITYADLYRTNEQTFYEAIQQEPDHELRESLELVQRSGHQPLMQQWLERRLERLNFESNMMVYKLRDTAYYPLAFAVAAMFMGLMANEINLQGPWATQALFGWGVACALNGILLTYGLLLPMADAAELASVFQRRRRSLIVGGSLLLAKKSDLLTVHDELTSWLEGSECCSWAEVVEYLEKRSA